MKKKNVSKVAFTTLFLFMVLSVTVLVTALVSMGSEDSSDTMAMLSKELKLSPEQTKQMGAEIEKFSTTVDQLKTDQEKEGAEPDALVKGAKKAQEEYVKAIKKILSQEQYNQYNTLKEKTLKGMFRDLAEIQLMDIQPKIGITDDQVTKMVPIMGDSLYEVVTLAWEHAGKRLRLPQKVRLAKKLKHIQKDARDATSKVLTPGQLQAWDKYKEQQQGEKNSK
jgi:hypothetical protein